MATGWDGFGSFISFGCCAGGHHHTMAGWLAGWLAAGYLSIACPIATVM